MHGHLSINYISTGILLLILVRYLLRSSRLININCGPFISKIKCNYASGPLWY
jgi:hypothetical protein